MAIHLLRELPHRYAVFRGQITSTYVLGVALTLVFAPLVSFARYTQQPFVSAGGTLSRLTQRLRSPQKQGLSTPLGNP